MSTNNRIQSYMKIQITYWQEADGTYLGYLNDYPDHWTQGTDLADLRDHLADLHREFTGRTLPGIKRVEEIDV
jgi:predicted RNase H-like HicB family nuclease